MIEAAPVHWFDEIDSTSEEAKRRARAGEVSPVWIAARQQTAGRGRLGRRWVSPTGNLFTTALFPISGGVQAAARIPFAAGLAVLDACAPLVAPTLLHLKWPNDVRSQGQKLCGILIESGETNGVLWVAAGIGINVRHTPENAGQAATSLLSLGAHAGIEPDHVLSGLRQKFAERLVQAQTGFDALLRDWLQHAEGRGQTIDVGPPEMRQRGIFEDLAPDGGLVLRLQDGTRQIIRAGDVELVRQVN